MDRNERGEPLTINLLEEAPAIDNGAVTPLLLWSVFIAVSGTFACGCAVGYSSPVESKIMDELGLSTAQFSLFGSLLTLGGLLGSIVSGRITDAIGRRGAFGFADALSLIGWITISISQEAWSLDLGRFLIGNSLGILIYVIPVYIAEITPKNVRGGFVSLTQLMQSCGIVAMFFAGSLISWRILVLIGIIPSLVQLLGIFLIPESPRFLARRDQSEACEKVLQRLRGNKADVSREAADIEEITERLKQIPQVSFVGLFQKKYARSLVVVFGLMALAGLGGPTGITFYASSILKSAGFTSSIGAIGVAVVQIPSAVIGMYMIDKCGRRPLLTISAAAMCFCCLLVGFFFFLEEKSYLESVNPYIIVVALWGYSAAFPFGMGAIPFVIMSEIFPMNVKGIAGSLAAVVSGGAVCIVSYSFNFVATEWSYAGAFFVLAWFNAIAVLFTVKMVPETKDRTLEEIQESLSQVLD